MATIGESPHDPLSPRLKSRSPRAIRYPSRKIRFHAQVMLSKLVSTQKDPRRKSLPKVPVCELTFSNFLPDAGRLLHTRAPVSATHRLETGFFEGDEVSSYYDPMVSRPNDDPFLKLRVRLQSSLSTVEIDRKLWVCCRELWESIK